jgi:hypothetical protein
MSEHPDGAELAVTAGPSVHGYSKITVTLTTRDQTHLGERLTVRLVFDPLEVAFSKNTVGYLCPTGESPVVSTEFTARPANDRLNCSDPVVTALLYSGATIIARASVILPTA